MIFLLSMGWAAGPADQLPDPAPERCIGFIPAMDDDNGMASPEGLTYDQVSAALGGVIQTALRCPRPPATPKLDLTFELVVGCDGIISSITVADDDGAPQGYLDCVSAVVQKADFPAHDMEDGMPVTYPVSVAW